MRRHGFFFLLVALLGCVLESLTAQAVLAAEKNCYPGGMIVLASNPKVVVGCLMPKEIGPAEQAICQPFTALIQPAANVALTNHNGCWICTSPELVPAFKDPAQWNKFLPNNYDCLGLCSECTCAQGTSFHRTRYRCVKETCAVPGLPDSNLQAGYFVEGGKLMREVGDANCTIQNTSRVWTPWFDRDNPSGNGDYEMLADLVAKGQVCGEQIDIQCRTTSGTPWDQTGQPYHCALPAGGYCQNSDQPQTTISLKPKCQDYEVRYCCDIGTP